MGGVVRIILEEILAIPEQTGVSVCGDRLGHGNGCRDPRVGQNDVVRLQTWASNMAGCSAPIRDSDGGLSLLARRDDVRDIHSRILRLRVREVQ